MCSLERVGESFQEALRLPCVSHSPALDLMPIHAPGTGDRNGTASLFWTNQESISETSLKHKAV